MRIDSYVQFLPLLRKNSVSRVSGLFWAASLQKEDDMSWWYELRGPDENLLLFGGGYPSREDAVRAAQIAKEAQQSISDERIILTMKTGISEQTFRSDSESRKTFVIKTTMPERYC
jgi:hypothetical protein